MSLFPNLSQMPHILASCVILGKSVNFLSFNSPHLNIWIMASKFIWLLLGLNEMIYVNGTRHLINVNF